MNKNKTIDPYQRGLDDFARMMATTVTEQVRCPYPPRSKAAQRWNYGWDIASHAQDVKDGNLEDDGGYV